MNKKPKTFILILVSPQSADLKFKGSFTECAAELSRIKRDYDPSNLPCDCQFAIAEVVKLVSVEIQLRIELETNNVDDIYVDEDDTPIDDYEV